MKLSQAQVEEFRDQGVLIVKDVLNDSDFAPVEAELTEFISRRAIELKAAGKIKELHENAPFDTRIALLFAQCEEIVGGIDIMPSVRALTSSSRRTRSSRSASSAGLRPFRRRGGFSG